MIDPNILWFNTPDTHTLCRAGGNGPEHISQLYAINKCVLPEMSFLDYGCGSATTLEAMANSYQGAKLPDGRYFMGIKYKGVDIIPKNIEWCKENFKGNIEFAVNPTIHKIDEPDKSWDVVYSRHVVDHMESFEKAMDEHKRVAKKLVIVILWVGFSNQDEHEIKNIDYRHNGGQLYSNEYTNTYSKKKVLEYLDSDPDWKLLEFNEDVGKNQVIVLKRNA